MAVGAFSDEHHCAPGPAIPGIITDNAARRCCETQFFDLKGNIQLFKGAFRKAFCNPFCVGLYILRFNFVNNIKDDLQIFGALFVLDSILFDL